jgi:hypothetical protein
MFRNIPITLKNEIGSFMSPRSWSRTETTCSFFQNNPIWVRLLKRDYHIKVAEIKDAKQTYKLMHKGKNLFAYFSEQASSIKTLNEIEFALSNPHISENLSAANLVDLLCLFEPQKRAALFSFHEFLRNKIREDKMAHIFLCQQDVEICKQELLNESVDFDADDLFNIGMATTDAEVLNVILQTKPLVSKLETDALENLTEKSLAIRSGKFEP